MVAREKKWENTWKKLCSINFLPTSLFTCQPHPESRFPGVGHGRGCIQDPLIQLPYPKSNGLIPSLTCQSTIYIIIYLSRWPEMEFQSTTGCTRSFLESQRCWHRLGLTQRSDRWMAWMAASLKIKMSCLWACVFGCPGTVPLWVSHIFLCFTQQPLWLVI